MTPAAAEARERVRRVWPGAWCLDYFDVWAVWSEDGGEVLACELTEDEAWINAAAGLPGEGEGCVDTR